MSRLFLLSVLILALTFCAESLFSQQPDSLIDRNNTITIEEILALPEQQIDIGLADLVLAKDFYPDLKIESFLYSFSYMADRFNDYFGQHTDPDKRVRALNTFLYKKGAWNDSITFGYDEDDLHVTKLNNKFINGYLAIKKGSCITMPMMYVILAERLGFPIYASRLPFHFFVRYIPEERIPKFQENIEATNGGSYVPDIEYKQTFQLPEKPIKNGVYLRTLSKKEYLASLLLISANEWIVRKDLDKARHYLELSMKYDPTFSSGLMNYAMLHLQEAMLLEQRMKDEKQNEIAISNFCSKNREINRTSQVSSTFEQPLKPPEPDMSALEVNVKLDATKLSASRSNQPTPTAQSSPNSDLQVSLSEITQRYAPMIKAKLDVYRKYKEKAEELGIVRDYPTSFFQIQSKSLKQVQEKGVK